MSWIAVDTGLPDHAKMAALPSDAARWGWLVTLCKAKEQRKPGIFASERHYRHVLVRHGKFLGDYIKAGLMEKGDDGTISVHDWQRHQWAGAKAVQREDIAKTSDGQSEDIPKTNQRQKEDASRAVPVLVSVSSSTEGGPGGNLGLDEDERRVFLTMARAGAHIRPESGMGQRVIRLMARRGAEVVLAELERLAKSGPLSDRQIVFGLEEALEKIPTAPKEADTTAQDNSRRIFDRMQSRRIEYLRSTGNWLPEWGERPEVPA